jgi:hypothetical protein
MFLVAFLYGLGDFSHTLNVLFQQQRVNIQDEPDTPDSV